jgi:hypothetical protein
LDIGKILKMDSLFFKNSLLKVFPQGVSKKKNKNQDTFRFWFVACKLLDFKKKIKKDFFISQEFFVECFSAERSKKKILDTFGS